MNPAILNSQVVQVALPIVLTISFAAWMNGRSIDTVNKRIDSSIEGVNKRLDDIVARLGRIETKLENHRGPYCTA